MFRTLRLLIVVCAGMLLAGCSSDTTVPGASPPLADAGGDTVLPDAEPVEAGPDALAWDATPTDSAPDTPAVGDRPNYTIDTYPRVDGSTSNLPLAMIIACELLGLPWKWDFVWDPDSQDLTRQVVPDPRTADQQVLAEAVVARIVHHKTHEAYMRLIDSDTELILVASLPSNEELEHASEMDVTLTARPVALDALVFLVNAENPVSGLTTQQIQQIYLGRTTRWDAVGGLPREIHPYVRPPNSGSQQLMESLVMEGLTMPDWPPDQVIMGMGGLINRIKTDEDAIGYSVYYYVNHMVSTDGLKVIGVDGEDPTPPTIRTRTYPYVAEVWVVTKSNLDPNHVAGQLGNWLLTPDGQAVVAMSEYVPVNL